MTRRVDLGSLPPEHRLRNMPMGSLNPMFKFRGDKIPPKPCGHWKMKTSTYNQLAEFWGRTAEFLVEIDE